MQTLKELIEKLTPELQEEARDFVVFLLERKGVKEKKTRGKPSFDWEGTLKNLRDKYTSVELQHKILEWRVGEE
jgi:hypothetical protein